MTPTARTLAHLRELGYVADRVDGMRGRITHDYLGVIDVLALRGREVLAVQVTSAPNVAARVAKMAHDDTQPAMRAMREAGFRIVVHGWRKDGRLREVDVS